MVSSLCRLVLTSAKRVLQLGQLRSAGAQYPQAGRELLEVAREDRRIIGADQQELQLLAQIRLVSNPVGNLDQSRDAPVALRAPRRAKGDQRPMLVQVGAVERALRTLQIKLEQLDRRAQQDAVDAQRRLMSVLELVAPLIANDKQPDSGDGHDQAGDEGARRAAHA